MSIKLSHKYLLATFITCAMCATVPFNMGGCADATGAIGGMIGGSQGQGLGHALGKGVEAHAMNEKDELAMGQTVAMQVTARYAIDADQRLNQYVVLVGLTLVDACPKPDGNWFFAVVDDQQANAFSGPAGYIFVTTAALREMRDESELAGVLAHEMTHVLRRHGFEAAKKAGFRDAFTEGTGAAMSRNNSQGSEFINQGLSVGSVAIVKGYDRGQEDQADAGAVKLLADAGYDPNGYLNFLKRISAEQKGKNGAFSTHPAAGARVQNVSDEIAKLPRGGATLADRFMKMTANVK